MNSRHARLGPPQSESAVKTAQAPGEGASKFGRLNSRNGVPPKNQHVYIYSHPEVDMRNILLRFDQRSYSIYSRMAVCVYYIYIYVCIYIERERAVDARKVDFKCPPIPNRRKTESQLESCMHALTVYSLP